MKLIVKTGSAALALALAACGGGDTGAANDSAASNAPAAPIPAPNGGDWTQTVSETAEGGFRMGNPDAPVKLVEYASLTCPHCADFSSAATGPLTELVKSGRVSWEFRHYMLFPTDLGASMLVRCQGTGPFFALTEQIYAAQPEWVDRVRTMDPAQAQQLDALPPVQKSLALMRATGLDQFFRQRGMPEARIEACLKDEAAMQRLAEITSRASTKEDVTGTPTFFINGNKVDNAATWEALQPALQAAL